MEIREALDSDIPEILEVLKASLGESSSKKTTDVWRYKHIDNPFGRSLVLVAIIDSKIVGVRAFMRWKWALGDKIFSAFRAVDTATDPNYQGRGIFKKLTLRALEIAKERGDSFIFNTPNSQSKPGYLKMGWREIDKLKLRLIPIFPYFKGKGIYNNQRNLNAGYKDFLERYNTGQKESKLLFTPKSVEFLDWRYKENPLQKYKIISGDNFYAAVYIKKHKYFKELRISECILDKNSDHTKLKPEIKSLARANNVFLISVSNNTDLFSNSLNGKFGPVLTFKNLNLEEQIYSNLMKIDNWNYTLGDLELF